MACTSNTKRSIHFSEPQDRDVVISLQLDLDVKSLVQRHCRCLIFRIPRDSALAHLHRLHFLCHGQLLWIRARSLPGSRLNRRARRRCLGGRRRKMLGQKRTGKLVFTVFCCFRLYHQVPSTVVGGWVPVSEIATKSCINPRFQSRTQKLTRYRMSFRSSDKQLAAVVPFAWHRQRRTPD